MTEDGQADEDTGGEQRRSPADLQAFAVQLRRMNGEINRLVHAFAVSQGLHATDVQALAAILDAPEPMTPTRLREHLGLTSGAVTACLDRLERAGHIRRSRDSADRRVVHLHYVSGARAAARTFFHPLALAADSARARFTAEELETALRFLTAVNDELGARDTPHR
ncbi:MarR family winged helix-turn-helix transcriptional regulator [Streptomyces sp. TRM49041]|uniref:MarR family winged helix-turn-helix transcriptional regulator n=1 Tax=Streptomyces sp. TRM49041 TaxID=2603216 RepID=UPI0021CC4F2C|nr:MarR family winged helix-turn-helix transcriptional regulator [Streptomyces sp. TRM49041]